MLQEVKYKHFVLVLIAVFSGVSTFAILSRVGVVEASYSTKPDVSKIETDEVGHVDDLKDIDPSHMIGTSTPSALYATTTQYILISFDGSKSIQSWEEVLNFAEEMKNSGTPVHFSFFINTAYLLSYGNKENYVSPDGKIGGSAIGFSDSRKDIPARVIEINRAVRDGHEIGSHTTGHNDGSKWTIDQWTKEFDSFDYILANVEKLNSTVTFTEPLMLKKSDIVGFRAPNLGIDNELYKVLWNRNFLYDASQVAKAFAWPFKDSGGLWHIPLGLVKNKNGGNILAMDYNWWYYQTGAKDALYKGTKQWQSAKDEVLKAYKDSFDSHYNGNNAPISIGHHFSMWNDGVYWEALKDFTRYACIQKDVRCVSHKEFVNAMEGR